jgi:hypothetical protein
MALVYFDVHGQPFRIKGKKPGPKNVVRKEVLSLRLYPAPIARLREAAKQEGVAVSAFIEKAILDGLCNTESVES